MVTNTEFSRDLIGVLCFEPAAWLQPTFEQQEAAVLSAKQLLDPLVNDISHAQITRRNDARRKRKRGSDEIEDPVLQLRQIYTAGLGVKQVWEQTRRVLDAAYEETERALESHAPSSRQQLPTPDKTSADEADASLYQGSKSESSMSAASDDQSVDDSEDISATGDLSPHSADEEDIEDEHNTSPSDEEGSSGQQPRAIYKQDPNKLNDGFFSIDDFNKQSQLLEQMDARGDEDIASDEDEIDWDANPLSQPLTKSKAGLYTSDSEDDSDNDQLPTFGNADLMEDDRAEEDDTNLDRDEMDVVTSQFVDTINIRYADFFEPPPRKLSKTKRLRALPKTQPPKSLLDQTAENYVDKEAAELERAIADVSRDLLETDDEISDGDEMSGVSDNSDALLPLTSSRSRNQNLSTHERQQLQIAEEIRRLEAVNISKKPWTLSGEASAGARPLNSLIEEDLEFERTGKPIPVITAEVSNDIEALIKRRILARDFDELVRRRPTTMDSAADTRRGRTDVLVDDAKPTIGLGDIYEVEYQRNTDPTTYADKYSTATKKQHEEIDRLWREVRDQLDVLGNLHFKPKRAEFEVKTVEDKPRIVMEDARPAVAGSGIDDDGTTLAPQEIYKPGVDSRADQGLVLNRKSGEVRASEEMSREEKIRRRRRDKERQKKANTNNIHRASPHSTNPSSTGKAKRKGKAEQEEILRDLQSGGVKVIGKDGELQSLSKKSRKKQDDNAKVESISSSVLRL